MSSEFIQHRGGRVTPITMENGGSMDDKRWIIAGNPVFAFQDKFEVNIGGGIPVESTRDVNNKRLTLKEEVYYLVREVGLHVDEVLILVERQPNIPNKYS